MIEIQKLNLLCHNKIDLFLDYFKCPVRKYRNRKVGCCPVHSGDNKTAFNYYNDRQAWCCFTRGCHKDYGWSPVYLIQGLLSKQHEEKVSFKDTVKFVCDALDTNFEDLPKLEIEQPVIEPRKNNNLDINIDLYKSRLIIPCPHYSKKFDKSIIEKQLIGFCNSYGKFFNQRSVVPILDRKGQNVIACYGRSIYEECGKCKGYHKQGFYCPAYYSPKWRSSIGFCTDLFLYNYWAALPSIISTKTIFITESVGNVLRLLEFGIDNAVACFGTQFSSYQQEIVENSGADRVIYIKDAGEAGYIASQRVQKILGSKCIVPELNLEDDIAKVPKIDFEKKILLSLKGWL